MELRAYADCDWEAVQHIYDLSKPDEMRGSVDLAAVLPLREDAAHLTLFRESSIVVATEDQIVVGFTGHKDTYISWIYVHPAHRRKGVGTLLVSHLLQHLPSPVRLNVGKNNRAARALYEPMGFAIEKKFTGRVNGHDVDVLTLVHKRS